MTRLLNNNKHCSAVLFRLESVSIFHKLTADRIALNRRGSSLD